ncbi:hypothetical protein TWF730_002313 [Orbilia blumenaviensis]|uniref:Uncharacterized protein n=1 Tax=Orbilia blumenaviensis TaxID=1796055 RepID=A0AAV9UDE3_9PEZI
MGSAAWNCQKGRLTFAAGCFIILNIPAVFTIPVNNHTLPSLPHSDNILDVLPTEATKTIFRRQNAVFTGLPPGTTQAGGEANLVFYGTECKLGLYDGGIREPSNGPEGVSEHIRWEGYPLGSQFLGGEPIVFPERQCINVKDLNSQLPNRISSFMLTGYCECKFHDREDCPNDPTELGFSAYNREDGALWRNGPHDDLIESFECWHTNHFNEFQSCSIRLAENPLTGIGKPLPPSIFGNLDPGPEGQVVERKFHKEDMEGTATRAEGESDCQKLPDGFVLNYFKINGCVCRFFKTDDCSIEGYHFTDGSPGKVEKMADTIQNVKAYRCMVPFGIPWVARDDI